ncbi:hypothetical protein C5167_000097, partial [Papaver somniferum]
MGQGFALQHQMKNASERGEAKSSHTKLKIQNDGARRSRTTPNQKYIVTGR